MVEWRPVAGFEGLYSVSVAGDVRSERFQRVMKPVVSPHGYAQLVFYKDRERFYVKVHRLVAETFIGTVPSGWFVCHRDGVKAHNHASNLYIGTPSDNMKDKQKHGTDHNRNRTHCPRGHLLVPPNLQAAKARNGWRSCRACHQARSDIFNGHPDGIQARSDQRYALIMDREAKGVE